MSAIREALIPTAGMHCRSCETLVELNVGEIEGVQSVAASAAEGVTRVSYDSETASLEDILEAIRRAGYEPRLPERS